MRHAIAFLVSTAILAAACSNPTDPDQRETLAGFELEVPRVVVEGESFDVVLHARGDRGTVPFAFDGPVALSSSIGSLAGDTEPVLQGGSGVATLSLVAAQPPIQLLATAAGQGGEAFVGSFALRALAGDPGDNAVAAIPDFLVDPDLANYQPDPEGISDEELAVDLLLVQLAPGATLAQVNPLISARDALVVGGIPGLAGSHAGFLALLLPTTTHEAIDIELAKLAQDSVVEAVVRDATAGLDEISAANGGSPAGWDWSTTPAGANWGLELIRVPQMWNLNAALAKAAARAPVGIVDNGFAWPHAGQDLPIDERYGGATRRDHGTHVAGTVAAAYDNGKGVDGILPFATLKVFNAANSRNRFPFIRQLQAVMGLGNTAGPPRVVNLSIGTRFTAPPVAGSASADRLAANARMVQALLALMRVRDRAPLVVAAAGNSSNRGFGVVEARWNSAWTWAGLEFGVPEILVVEALRHTPGSEGDATRANFSNIGGDVSAPGVAIWSTGHSQPYLSLQGTSMASPHITGVLGYLLAASPGLSNAQLREILLACTVPVAGGAADRVDAWDALLMVDDFLGNNEVLTSLLDVDDGSRDGNRRIDVDGNHVDEPDADGDGGVGDGEVDMSDFRVFRDAYVHIFHPADEFFDGRADHPRRDLNGDGEVRYGDAENVYPRCDFNGDGRLHPTEKAWVGGRLQLELNDLEVLQQLFDDPHYAPGELPGLLASGDVVVVPAGLFVDSVDRGRAVVLKAGELLAVRDLPSSGTEPIFTLPTDELVPYTFRLLGFDSGGSTLLVFEEEIYVGLGSDYRWAPSPPDTVYVEITAPEAAVAGEPFPVLVRAGIPDDEGTVQWSGSLRVSMDAIAGSVSPASGTTDPEGWFECEGTLEANGAMTLFATVSDDFAEEGVAAVVVQPAVGSAVALSARALGIEVQAWATGDDYEDCRATVDSVLVLDVFEGQTLTEQRSCSLSLSGCTRPSISTSARALATATELWSPGGGQLQSLEASGESHDSGIVNDFDSCSRFVGTVSDASSSFFVRMEFASETVVRFQGTLQVSAGLEPGSNTSRGSLGGANFAANPGESIVFDELVTVNGVVSFTASCAGQASYRVEITIPAP